MGTVGQQIYKIIPDFDPRTYGFRQLGALVEKTNAFEIDRAKGGAMRIRLKPAKAANPPRQRHRKTTGFGPLSPLLR